MAAMEATGPSYSREVLSTHETRATFTGVEAGMEPMLRIFPPQPAKQWAVFAITEYISYSKPGQYGDEKTERFEVLLDEPRGKWIRVKYEHMVQVHDSRHPAAGGAVVSA